MIEMRQKFKRLRRLPKVEFSGEEKSVKRRSLLYLSRYLETARSIEKNSLEFACWILRDELECIGTALLTERERQITEAEYDDLYFDPDYCSMGIWDVLKRKKASCRTKALRALRELVGKRLEALPSSKKGSLEVCLKSVSEIFSFSEDEKEFCAFFYLIANYDPVESFFVSQLQCHRPSRRSLLSHILDLKPGRLMSLLAGKLMKLGLFEFDRNCVSISEEFQEMLDKDPKELSSKHFSPVTVKDPLPLEAHFIPREQVSFVRSLLEGKPVGAVNILLYGPPGTGKTSFAHGLVKTLGVPSYSINRSAENTTMTRRMSLVSCLKMTNSGEGSIILVDEADNILNTEDSYFSRGETQDKGWLNQLLEEPGSRIIWITNKIYRIEDSVLRRFAFSLNFKSLAAKQRELMWNNIARMNKADSYFNSSELKEFASRYSLSAGAVDLAFKAAFCAGKAGGRELHEAIGLGLNAHEMLMNGGEAPQRPPRPERFYSLEGLSMEGDPELVLSRLESFDRFIAKGEAPEGACMTLLFYGPPGSGKTELGRYIAQRLGRELMVKGPSDILGPYLGESEANLKDAFEKAKRDDAILMIDEVDTFLYSRDRAQRSWEMSLTNEFLTQMEKFRGILLCTTNRLDGLDYASLRRFHHKIGFKYLTFEGKVIFYKKMFSDLVAGSLNSEEAELLKTVPDLTPGDFKSVREALRYQKGELTHLTIITALGQEAKIKAVNTGKKGTPGF
ncbi:MAG: AAA family ATPase [Desulfobacteraceae bacterium]|nr:MAG: AAA family ATPase [Desulfobacteraceae bacterium]